MSPEATPGDPGRGPQPDEATVDARVPDAVPDAVVPEPVPDAVVPDPVPDAVVPEPVVRHGSIRLLEDRCTSCMICARECPAWCIHIDSHTEVVSGQGGAPIGGAAASRTSGYARARERSRNVLDRFQIDFDLCMYCGICIEQCPFDALEWAGPHVASTAEADGLHHQREQLR